MEDSSSNVLGIFERIATSLESIADSFEQISMCSQIGPQQPELEWEQSLLANADCEVVSDYSPTKGLLRLAGHFREHGFGLVVGGNSCMDLVEPLEFDAELNNLAEFIGSNYEAVQPFLQQIKNRMQLALPFEFSLAHLSPESRQCILQLAQDLYRLGFFERCTCTTSPRPVFNRNQVLYIEVNSIGMVQNFFSGMWFERCVALRIGNLVKQVAHSYGLPEDCELFRNLQVRSRSDAQRELDLVVEAFGHYYWVECKSGDFEEGLHKYSTMASGHRLDSSRCFLVVAEPLSSKQVIAYKHNYSINVWPLVQLEARMLELLKIDAQRYKSDMGLLVDADS